MKRPAAVLGLHHIALWVANEHFDSTLNFYLELVGMEEEWRPDADNVYLTSGRDNLALHRRPESVAAAEAEAPQRLDHIGFILSAPAEVDRWYEFLASNGVKMAKNPKTHRDGARSFYCYDPAGTLVQFIFHPPLSPLPAG